MPHRRILLTLILAAATKPALAQSAAPFTLSATPASLYANSPATLTASGLPPAATGSVIFTDGSTTLATTTISGTTAAHFQAFGDSITIGPSYANLLASTYNLTLADEAIANTIACDILPTEILNNNLGPSRLYAPLSSLVTGSNDAVTNTASYDPIFRACHQAALAWLAIPIESKLLAGDPAISILSGSWTADPATFNSLINTTGGAIRYNVTTAGAPIYLWQLLADAIPGSFTIAIDGVPSATIYTTQTTPAIASRNTPQLRTFGLIRLPVLAGAHTVDITALSGAVGILAVATAGTSLHPTVLVTDVPNQIPGNSAAIAQYTADIRSDVSLLASDGLDLRYIPTQTFMLGTPSEMLDAINPNSLGQSHLASAFTNTLGSLDPTPFTSFINTPAVATAAFANSGPHNITATYSGDSNYAPSTSAVTVTVLAQQTTLTALATPATHAYAGSSVAFTTTVSPATATGTITLYDGTQFLAQLPLTSGATFFSTATLAVGIHTLTAVYSGDTANISSSSPTLSIQIEPTPTSLNLAPIAATAIYGPPTNITASITPTTATGTINLFDGSQQIGSGTLANGAASFSPLLAVGAHSLSAVYTGDPSDLPTNSAALTITIQPIATTTTLTAPPATSAYGTPLTFTAGVLPATATGIITFHDSAAGTLSQSVIINGSAGMTTSSLSIGTHTLTAIYAGDATHAASSSQPINFQIVANATTTTLSAIATTYDAGAPVTLYAQITPATATGTILFRDASAGTLSQSTVANGAASLALNASPPGRYSITATYSGDATDAPSTSAAIATQIILAPTTTTLAQPATAAYATPVTLTATITPATATGLVQFADATGPIATALATNGSAAVQLRTLTTGTHLLHASYLGDTLDATSTSASNATAITADITTTTLSLAESIIPAGGFVTFNVRVTSEQASDPTGTITISSGSSVLATGMLTNAANGAAYATLSISAATLGTSTVIAAYAGDANDLPSTSAPVAFTIVATPTTASLTLSASVVPLQSTVTLTAAVASAAQVPTGSILFTSNGKPLTTMPLNSSGQASTTLTSPTIGAYAITATFLPTGLFAASTAPPQTLTVTAPIALTLTPATINATSGSAHTATLTITPLSGFSGAISAQCQSPQSYISCTIDAPPSINAPTTATIHITIPTTNAASIFPLLSLLLLPLLFHRKRYRNLLALMIAVAVLGTSSCANGGNFFSIPNGSSSLTIVVTAAGAPVSTTLTVNISQ